MWRLLAGLFLVATAAVAQGEKKHLLFVGQGVGFAHDSVSYAMYTMAKIGETSGLFDVMFRTDAELLTKKKLGGNRKNLDYFDAVMFYTTGELTMDDSQKADLLNFVREDGKGFLGTHSATDTFYKWPEYGELIGGYFDRHPWHQEVTVRVEDRNFPATRHLPPSFTITDEIYQFKSWSRDRIKVLMSLDPSSVDLTRKDVRRTDKDFGVAWYREYGKGRVFYCSLGHRNSVWDRADMQKMWLEAMRWALGTGTKPRP